MPLRITSVALLLAVLCAAPAHAQTRQVGRFLVTRTTDPGTGADASVAAVTETAPTEAPAALVWACNGSALRTAFAFPGTWTSTDAFLSWRFDALPTESREVTVQPVEGALAVVLPPEVAVAITGRARDARTLLVSLETDEGRQLHAFDLEGAAEALETLACAAATPTAAVSSAWSGAPARSYSLDEVDVKPRLLNAGELAAAAARVHPPALRNRGAEVRIRLRVRQDGVPDPEAIMLVHGARPEFYDAARAAVEVARFSPGMRGGVAVPVWMEVPVTFRAQPGTR